MKKVTLFSLSLLLLAACSSDNEPQSGTNTTDPVEIKLNAGIQSVNVISRAPINNDFSADFSTNFIALPKGTSSYPADYTGLTALSATVAGASGHAITFTPSIYYQANGSSTKLIGWYPNTGTFNAANAAVTFDADIMDGETDLMMTPQQEGDKESTFSAFNFSHLLTQIRVSAIADNATSVSGWGDISSITVLNKKQDCVLTLPGTTLTAPQSATVAFGGTSTANLPLVSKNWSTDLAISTVSLSTSSQPCGYALFAPQTYSTAGTGVKLEVVTSVGGTRTVEIPQTLDAGTAYAITLTFSQAGITPTATVSTWNTGTSVDVPVQ
ncbi:fimbrillin family protein [uncultured Bacteroides sp.]|uniref:fimbrillin family protein n=1 Tax=uncultured Bacteroides sp. TaxID=162156 RepID=UPI002AAB6CBD|nr:fimbrillin family protein [uncultured Bacteroides sp.]